MLPLRSIVDDKDRAPFACPLAGNTLANAFMTATTVTSLAAGGIFRSVRFSTDVLAQSARLSNAQVPVF